MLQEHSWWRCWGELCKDFVAIPFSPDWRLLPLRIAFLVIAFVDGICPPIEQGDLVVVAVLPLRCTSVNGPDPKDVRQPILGKLLVPHLCNGPVSHGSQTTYTVSRSLTCVVLSCLGAKWHLHRHLGLWKVTGGFWKFDILYVCASLAVL